MKSLKRIMAMVLALIMTLSLAVTAFGAIILEPEGDEYKIAYYDGSKLLQSTDYTKTDKNTTLSYNPTKTDYVLDGWKINGTTYDVGKSYKFDEDDGELNSKGKYVIKATAVWESDEEIDGIVVTYKPGEGEGNKFKKTYTDAYKEKKGYYIVTLAEPKGFTNGSKTFEGWIIPDYDQVLKAGEKIAVNENMTITASWSGKKVIGDDTSSSTSSSTSSAPAPSSTSSTTSSAPAPSSSAPQSSVPASSGSSSESAAEPESPQEPQEEPVPEEPEFKPTTLAYNINGDIPVSGIKFEVKEDIGGVPSLFVSNIDSYSAVDETTSAFVASGNALAAFDISMLKDGNNYSDKVNGVLTYELNGTQATAISEFEKSVLGIAHVMDAAKFEGSAYYMTDGKKTYLYDVASGSKSEVKNINFVEENGVYRPVISDIDTLGNFAYQSKEGTIVEVKLMPDENAESVSMDVYAFSPFILARFEVGEAKAAGGGSTVWIIVAIAVAAVIIAAVLIFLMLKKGGKKKHAKANDAFDDIGSDGGATITGLDE